MGFSRPEVDAAAVSAGVDALLHQLAAWKRPHGDAGEDTQEQRQRRAFVGTQTEPPSAPLGVLEALHRALHASVAAVRGCVDC